MNLSPYEEGQDAARRRKPRKIPPALAGTKAANRWLCGYDIAAYELQHAPAMQPQPQQEVAR